MKFNSTNNTTTTVSGREALLQGLAPDGGLFVPCELPTLPKNVQESLQTLSLQEISHEITRCFFGDEIANADIESIICDAINFEAPLAKLSESLHILELFHGPTLAFKDFGARFMSRTMSYFRRGEDKELTILVATSGDTGSAVAHGFHNVEGIRVVVLYPSGKVSNLQEKQLTTMGGNITSLEILGTFDDCQKLVKQAFVDRELTQRMELSSANSINIGRLIPQMFYYIHSASQCGSENVTFSVPSGNFGNLTAGLYAKHVCLPNAKFIAATNINDVVPRYLATGKYEPRPSEQTISNAMDVGAPSNFDRILNLYRNNIDAFRREVSATSYTDEQTRQAIKEVYDKYSYVIDPHGAVGYAAFRDLSAEKGEVGIVVETAHPAKFKEVVDEVIGRETPIPEQLAAYLEKDKQATTLNTDYNNFREFLYSL